MRNKSYKTKKILLALMLSMAMSTNVANADVLHDENTPLSLNNKISTLSQKYHKTKGKVTGFATPYARQVIEPGNTVSFDDASFDGDHIDTLTENAYGGAIYNQGTISSITNAIFQNNYAQSASGNALGGAIYNASSGEITITAGASDNNILFTNNWTMIGAEKTYNDIYNTGTINLNAAEGKNITFNGAVTGEGTLVLNNGDSTEKGGEYVFNNGINDQILEMHNGARIRLGKVEQEDGTTTYGKLNLAGFRPITDAGLSPQEATVILDLRNDYIDVHQFGHVIQGASVNHMLDVDLLAGTADRFDALSTTAVTGDILVGGLNLMSGSGDDQMIVNLSRNTFRFAFSLTRDILENITKAEGVTYDVHTLDYDYFSGNLIFNAEEFIPNGGTLDRVYKNSRDYLNLGIGQHATYSSSDIVSTRDDDHPYIVIINGEVFYFAPHESTEELSNAVIDLAATGSTAIKEVGPEDNYIFEKGGRYYTYTTIFLPKSVWYNDLVADPSDGYNYYQTDGTTNKYYNVVLREDLMNAIDTTIWTKSDSTTASDYTWVPNNYIPLASKINPVMDGDNLKSASGMVRFNLPYNGTTTETRYYKYDYTVPADYTRQTSRITMSDNYITNLYFYGLSNGSKGSSVYNNTTANYNINADFIGNTTSSDGGGAIYNDTSGTLGFISGTFINNTSSSNNGGVMFNNKGTVKALIGDFIGNYSKKSGGVIRNVSGNVGLIQGKFIGNRAGDDSTSGWGGVISNKETDSRIEIILGDFIGNRASTGGGAIDMNGRLGTVIGDFIGNYAKGDDGGGAVRVEGGFIGSVTGDFIGNWAKTGGAIYTMTKQGQNPAEIGTVYSDFIGNQATSGNGGAVAVYAGASVIGGIYGNFINNSATGSGAAIYSKGKINRVSANFTDNVAGSKGGAIYLDENSVVALYADVFGDILFTDNQAGETESPYNDVYSRSGTLRLNAKAYTEESVTKQHTITFDGSIEGSGGSIHINSDSTEKGGKYIFNNTVSGNKIYLYNNADVKLGSVTQSNNSNNVGRFNVNVLQNDVNHGSIDLQNEYIEPEAQSFGAVTLKSDLYLKIDADLVNELADKFSATSFTSSGGTYKFMIDSINVLADNPSDSAVEVNVADDILRTHFGLSNSAINVEGATRNYAVTYSSATGNLKFSDIDLYSAVHSEESERSYNMLSDENLWCDLGTMAGSGSTLSINGNGHDINGYDDVSHYSGITVNS